MSADQSTLVLRLDAPFSAWRWLQAGVFRGTFPVIPHSAAWGMALNLAGIESRGDLAQVVTPIRADAPTLEIAVGIEKAGERATVYQQLHSYPVGNSGAELKAKTFGNKYWIAPAKREILVGLVAVVGVRGPRALVERIPLGLAGNLDADRYGLPFAGDNQFLFSRIDIVDQGYIADWFVPVDPDDSPSGSTRLTTNIDRGDSSKTQTPLFQPVPQTACPPESWITIGPLSTEVKTT